MQSETAQSVAQMTVALRVGIAALVGLLVGLEREWSGHASGPHARFAGIRTFLLLGITGGIAGALAATSHELVAGVIVLAACGLAIAAYVAVVRTREGEVDGTTEAAAITVVALGVASGVGWVSFAAGAGSLVVLALREKARLHAFVAKVGEAELRAALQFAALALVVLPLLPRGPILGELAIEPRSLWIVVLIFMGVNYGGYLIRHAVGPNLGYGIAGALGGLISSTAVTLTFARQSKRDPDVALPLARGILAASSVLALRIFFVALVLDAAVAVALTRYLVPLALLSGALAWRVRIRNEKKAAPSVKPESPLGLASALEMAVALQVAMVALRFAREWWGTSGQLASAAFLGLADMDALTFSSIRAGSAGAAATTAAIIAVGLLTNTLMKAAIASVAGTRDVRRVAGVGLLLLAGAVGVALLTAL